MTIGYSEIVGLLYIYSLDEAIMISDHKNIWHHAFLSLPVVSIYRSIVPSTPFTSCVLGFIILTLFFTSYLRSLLTPGSN